MRCTVVVVAQAFAVRRLALALEAPASKTASRARLAIAARLAVDFLPDRVKGTSLPA